MVNNPKPMNTDPVTEGLLQRHPGLSAVMNSISRAAGMMISCYSSGGKILLCGNGGSSSDAEHVTGELMKTFELPRPLDDSLKQRLEEIGGAHGKMLGSKLEHALPAICLSSQTALTSAIANDIGNDMVYAQQIIGYGNENDILIAISTSGNSPNVVNACITAKALNMTVIGLTGESGGKIRRFCDILLNVPESNTALVQELHLPVLHTLCKLVENHFYGK